ncbi:MAG: GIY-YIG nuclease family protein [Bacteroidales bacterium]|nr:GIY-YIG nuclease family protein [Bacteroidales bacterium]
MRQHNHFVYILTNRHRTVLYTGVTNDLIRRVYEHKKGYYPGFTKKYKCKYLIYYERFQYIQHAILWEKRIKGWTRAKKEKLISNFNPHWKFLNNEIREW